jgi:large subunit ribosomal protein L15
MFKHELKPAKGANKERKRLGRGTGSGLGTTSGKGHKGQKARKGGGKTHPGYEGGQMPMTRRIPKRGFSNARFATEYEVVNLDDIEACFENGGEVNIASLKANSLVHGNKDGVKILGDGDIKKKLSFVVNKVSATAEEKIKAAGGEVKLLPAYTENAEVKARKEAKEAKKAAKAKKGK